MFDPQPEPDSPEEVQSEDAQAGAHVEAPVGAPGDIPTEVPESVSPQPEEPVEPPASDVPLPVEVPTWAPQADSEPAPPEWAPPAPEPVAEVPPVPEPVADVPAIPEPVAEVPPVPEPVAEVPAIPEPVAETPAVSAPTVPDVFSAPVPEPAASEVPAPPAPPEPPVVPAPPAVDAPVVPDVFSAPAPAAAADVPPPAAPQPEPPALDPMFRAAAPSEPSETPAPASPPPADGFTPFGSAAPTEAAPASAAAPPVDPAGSFLDAPQADEPGFGEPAGLAPVIPIDLDGKWIAGRGSGSGTRSRAKRGLSFKRTKDDNPFQAVEDQVPEAEAAVELSADASVPPAEPKRGFGREIRFGRKNKKKEDALPVAAAATAGFEGAALPPSGVPQSVPVQPSGPDATWGAAPSTGPWGAPAPGVPASAPAPAPVEAASPVESAPAPAPVPVEVAPAQAASAPATPTPASIPPPPPGAVPQAAPYGGSAEPAFPAPEYTPEPPKRGLHLPAFFSKRSGGKGSRGPIALIVVLALVVAGLGYMFLGRGGGASSPAFALDLSAGQTYTYQMTMAMNAQASVAGRTVPVQEQMAATMKWDVQSVDSQGIATVSVDMSNFAAKVNGQPVSTASIPKHDTHFTMRIAKDGTILSGGGFGMLGGSNATTSNLPGADQLTPLLPGHNVQPGATWTKSYHQTLPYGMGTVHAKTHSTYLRNEDVNGTSAAVIVTTLSMPLHLRINLRDMMRKLGSSTAGLPAGANPVMTYGGKITGQTTGWFDPVARQMLKSSMTAQFVMRIGITGVPGSALGGLNHFGLSGTMTMSLQRV